MLPFLAKEILQMGLSEGPGDEESIWGNPDGPSLISWVLKSRKFFPAVLRMSLGDRKRIQGDVMLPALKMGERATSQGMTAASRNEKEGRRIMVLASGNFRLW